MELENNPAKWFWPPDLPGFRVESNFFTPKISYFSILLGKKTQQKPIWSIADEKEPHFETFCQKMIMAS